MGAATILVVEDEADVREALVEALVSYGYSVVAAADGEQALAELRASSEIKMLITDVRMLGMSGLQLAEHARALNPAIRIIMVSGHFLPQQVAGRFLKKPFHMRELASAVAAELA